MTSAGHPTTIDGIRAGGRRLTPHQEAGKENRPNSFVQFNQGSGKT